MDLIHVSVVLAALGLFLAIFYGPWQTLCIDWARQRMFEARDRVFDAARRGDIPFDSTEYRECRLTIERMIRFSHHLSWPRLILMQLVPRNMIDRAGVRDVLSAMPIGRAKEEMERAFATVAYAIVLCVLGRSLFLGPIFVAIRGLHIMHGRLTRFLFSVVDEESRAIDFNKPAFRRVRYRHP